MACSSLTSVRLSLDWDMVLQRYEQDVPGPAIDPADLPLSSDTVAALWRWYRAHAEQAFDDVSVQSALDQALDRRLVEQEGLRLWRVVQEELGPSCRVAFMSERFCGTFTTAEAYELAVALDSSG